MPVTSPGAVEDLEYIGSWFSVEFDNKIEGNFTEVTGLNVSIQVVSFQDSNKDTVTRKRPGTTTYSEITLKRTLSPDKTFWEWAKKIRDGGKDYRTNGAIVLHDISGAESGRWSFQNAWPSKWAASDLTVGTDDPMIEQVTLQVELLTRDK